MRSTFKSMLTFFSSALLSIPLGGMSQPTDTTTGRELSLSDLFNLEVSLSAKMTEKASDVPMSLYVVTLDEMKRWGSRLLYEVLARTPGYAHFGGSPFGQEGVIARGMGGIWRQSVAVETAQLLDPGHWLFSPYMFKQIEVGRGPAELTWGSRAEMGLCNLVVRDDLAGLELHRKIGNNSRYAGDILYGAQSLNSTLPFGRAFLLASFP